MKNRALWAIAKKAFRNSGGLKTQISIPTFLMGLIFTFVFIAEITSLMAPWRDYFYRGDEAYGIVTINTPDSLNEFLEENHSDIRIIESEKYDVSPYDFVQYGKIMRQNNAFITFVFPEDFDERVYKRNGNTPQILTYYRTDSVEYTDWKNFIVDTYIQEYLDYLNTEVGKTAAEYPPIEIAQYPVETSAHRDGIEPIVIYTATSVIPLVIFILVLYLSMNSGTNVISGEKEKGTFAGVLLSPIPRKDIIIGNILGVVMSSMIPATALFLLCTLLPFYSGISGLITGLPLLLSLAVFIASATILISVMNDSVVSAQTAFLPVFFIFVTIGITCIHNVDQAEHFYSWIPIYGQFYGIGNILTDCDIFVMIDSAVCTLTTLLLSLIIITVSIKMLDLEAFTVYSDADSDKKDRRYLVDPVYKKSLPGFLTDQITYPLVILSIFQMLAIIPTAIKYMGESSYADFIENLQYVTTIPEIISISFEVLGIFLSDPLFLCLMALGYLLIIVCYFLKTRRLRIGKERRKFSSCMNAIGLNLRKSAVFKYLGGLLFGAGLMSLVYLVLKLTGQIRFNGWGFTSKAVPVLISSIIMWIPQGACEEVMFRGYMLPVLKKRTGKIWSFIISSLLFSLFHSMNVGYTPLASINLFLIALFFALISYRSGSIWITCGAHTAWNFCQGNLYGLQVSGSDLSAAICDTRYTKGAKAIITGGSFGPEGGLAVTAVIVPLLIILLIAVIRDRNKKCRLWD